MQAFGWDMLLVAAADEAKFARVLERFGQYTLHHARAWAQTSIPVYIQHDDIVWTSGPFIRPDFYREVIFPIYRELWKPVKAAGKKVIYCSDGTVDMFMEDIADCGADGFIFEPCNNFEKIVKTLGGSHCLFGSKVDCRTMTSGSWEQVRAEIDANPGADARRARSLLRRRQPHSRQCFRHDMPAIHGVPARKPVEADRINGR